MHINYTKSADIMFILSSRSGFSDLWGLIEVVLTFSHLCRDYVVFSTFMVFVTHKGCLSSIDNCSLVRLFKIGLKRVSISSDTGLAL